MKIIAGQGVTRKPVAVCERCITVSNRKGSET
jgi:hypothetical protein